jgi:hypothetical protein
LIVKNGDKCVEKPHVDSFRHRAGAKGKLGSKAQAQAACCVCVVQNEDP